MALSTEIVVKDIRIESKTRSDGTLYDMYSLTSEKGVVYRGFLGKNLKIPDIEDKINLVYQDINGYNSIIQLRGDSMPKLETKNNTETNDSTPNQVEFKGTLFYAKLRDPDTKGEFPTNKYILDASISDNTIKVLESLGVEVKKDALKGNFVRVRSKNQPKVFNNEGTQFNDVPLIGNGSTATIKAGLYKNKAKKGGDMCLGLREVHLINHIEYSNTIQIEE